jgi:hypothetical protein
MKEITKKTNKKWAVTFKNKLFHKINLSCSHDTRVSRIKRQAETLVVTSPHITQQFHELGDRQTPSCNFSAPNTTVSRIKRQAKP